MSGSHDVYEALTVAATAVPFTAATFANRDHLHFTVEAGAVRLRVDGTAPTASEGHELEVGDAGVLESPDEIQKGQFIRRDGVTATLRGTGGRGHHA